MGEDELHDSGKLASKIMEYLRLSILMFYGIEKIKKKISEYHRQFSASLRSSSKITKLDKRIL